MCVLMINSQTEIFLRSSCSSLTVQCVCITGRCTILLARGCLNIIRNFGSHGHLPWIEIAQFCIEAATLITSNVVYGRLSGSGCLPGTLW